MVCAARTLADLEATAAEVRARGRRALAVRTRRHATATQLERLVAAALAEFGRLDLLVNNAGGTPPARRPSRPASDSSRTALRFN